MPPFLGAGESARSLLAFLQDAGLVEIAVQEERSAITCATAQE
jgi:hypothetical protein